MVVITSSSTSFDLISRRRQTSAATISWLLFFYIHTCNLVTMLECQQSQFILQKYDYFFSHIDNIFFCLLTIYLRSVDRIWSSCHFMQLVRCTQLFELLQSVHTGHKLHLPQRFQSFHISTFFFSPTNNPKMSMKKTTGAKLDDNCVCYSTEECVLWLMGSCGFIDPIT